MKSIIVQITKSSQYPLRRASSWRYGTRWFLPANNISLNTLSGGHPLGGCRGQTLVVVDYHKSQYPLRRASSWRN